MYRHLFVLLTVAGCSQAPTNSGVSPRTSFSLACIGSVETTAIRRGQSTNLGSSPTTRDYVWNPASRVLTIVYQNGVREPFCSGAQNQICTLNVQDHSITANRSSSTSVNSGYFEVENFNSAGLELSLSNLRAVQTERRGGRASDGDRTEAGTTEVYSLTCRRTG